MGVGGLGWDAAPYSSANMPPIVPLFMHQKMGHCLIWGWKVRRAASAANGAGELERVGLARWGQEESGVAAAGTQMPGVGQPKQKLDVRRPKACGLKEHHGPSIHVGNSRGPVRRTRSYQDSARETVLLLYRD